MLGKLASNTLVPSFSEEEMSVMLEALFKVVDAPQRRSEPATKTVLLDFFGPPNSGKTTITVKIEQLFRRHKFNAFCPPETAEIAEIRNKSTDSPTVFQARHLTGVLNLVLNLSNNRDFHVEILSRGLIDMLFWYEIGFRDGVYSETHVGSVRNYIYEALRENLVDAFVFFTCSPETALEREHEHSLTKKRGSKMNEEFLEKAGDVYEAVLADLKKNVPDLPLISVDTSDKDIGEVTEEVMQGLLPILLSRFSVPETPMLIRSPTLLRKKAERGVRLEEQLKLKGHPESGVIEQAGWLLLDKVDQLDAYLVRPDRSGTEISPNDETVRVRNEKGRLMLMYKSPSRDPWFSHRMPLTLDITAEEAEEIMHRYFVVAQIQKARKRYGRCHTKPREDEVSYTLHLDSIEGMGDFTEIRAHGPRAGDHAKVLLELATTLGFTPADIVKGSYLANILPALSTPVR